MATNRIVAILKVAVWPIVVLILVTIFMILFRSSIQQFIIQWESLKMGGVEVKVKNEQERQYLENLLSERDVLILDMRENLDSLNTIILTLEEENKSLASKLKEASKKLSKPERKKVQNIVKESEQTVLSSDRVAKDIENSVAMQYKNLELISDKDKFKTASEFENEGFELFLEKDYEGAIAAFKKSESVFPSVKMKRPLLSTFIEKNLKVLKNGNPATLEKICSILIEDYSAKMDPKVKEKLKASTKP